MWFTVREFQFPKCNSFSQPLNFPYTTLFLDLLPLALPHSDYIQVIASLKISCPELTTSWRAWHSSTVTTWMQAPGCSFSVGPMGLHSLPSWSPLHQLGHGRIVPLRCVWFNKRLRTTNLHHTVLLAFLTALLCSTHGDLVVSWPQILNYD